MAFASVGAIGIMAAVAVVTAEAAGMGKFHPLPSTNMDQLTAALYALL